MKIDESCKAISMKKLVEENEKIDRQDEEINGKIDRRG
jgi:hypothetical protein